MLRSYPAALLVLTLVPAAFAAETIEDHKDDGLREITLVGPEATDVSLLASFYRDLLRGTVPRTLIVSAFANRLEADQRYGGIAHTEATFEEWYKLYRLVKESGPLHATELVRIGNDAVIRSVDGSRLARVILSGADPTSFE